MSALFDLSDCKLLSDLTAKIKQLVNLIKFFAHHQVHHKIL